MKYPPETPWKETVFNDDGTGEQKAIQSIQK